MTDKDDLKEVIDLLIDIEKFFQIVLDDLSVIRNVTYRNQLIDIWNESISTYITKSVSNLKKRDSFPQELKIRGMSDKQLQLKKSLFLCVKSTYINCTDKNTKIKIAIKVFDIIRSILGSIGNIYIDSILEFIDAIRIILELDQAGNLII